MMTSARIRSGIVSVILVDETARVDMFMEQTFLSISRLNWELSNIWIVTRRHVRKG